MSDWIILLLGIADGSGGRSWRGVMVCGFAIRDVIWWSKGEGEARQDREPKPKWLGCVGINLKFLTFLEFCVRILRDLEYRYL